MLACHPNERATLVAIKLVAALVAQWHPWHLPYATTTLSIPPSTIFLLQLNKWLIDVWPAWRDKMLADPEFAYKLMVEETVCPFPAHHLESCSTLDHSSMPRSRQASTFHQRSQ